MVIALLVNDITRAGGTERITVTLANSFVKHGHDVTIVSNWKENRNLFFDVLPSVQVIFINNQISKRSKFQRILQYMLMIPKLNRNLKDLSFDIVIGQSFPMNLILSFVSAKFRHIACEHTYYGYYPYLIRLFRNIVYRQVNKVVVLNSTDKTCFEKYLKNVIVIPNMNYFIEPEKKTDLSQKRIISAGRLEYHKGFDLLIKAISPVLKKHPDWVLNIYGDGPCKQDLLEMIEMLRLQNNVFLKGKCQSLNEAYLSSSIYVLPSRFEGFGLVLIEAAAFGLPLISFNCPNGPSDILADDLGILVQNGNIEELRSAILFLVEHPEKRERYGSHGNLIISRYSEETIYPIWEKILG